MNDGAALGLVLDQVSKDKNIDRSVLVETLEQAILTAAKRAFGMHREMEAKFNEETGRVDLFQIIVIVEQVTRGRRRARRSRSRTPKRFNLKAEVGDELLFQIFYDEKDQAKAEEQDAKYGELLELNRAWKGFGRIAAQTAKQVILQRVREAERENVFNEYKDRKGELISGIVRRFERGNIIVDLGGAEAVLPVRDQVPRESYRAGDRIVAYVVDIDKTARGPQIILSRTHKGLLEKLFEMEVPEIYEKIVRIEASAREAGARSKIAVSSRDRDVDPVGACVGMKGSRVQAVVQELRGEKIDIVPYDADPARFVCNAIAPAEVARVIIDAGTPHHGAGRPRRQAVAGDRQEGAERPPRVAAHRLAHRHPLGVEGPRDGGSARAQSLASIEGVGTELAETLFKLGWRSAAEVAGAKPEELASVAGHRRRRGGEGHHRRGREARPRSSACASAEEAARVAGRAARRRPPASCRGRGAAPTAPRWPQHGGALRHAACRWQTLDHGTEPRHRSTCVGCRRRGLAAELARLVAASTGSWWSGSGRRALAGAWGLDASGRTHASRRRSGSGAFARAFRCRVQGLRHAELAQQHCGRVGRPREAMATRNRIHDRKWIRTASETPADARRRAGSATGARLRDRQGARPSPTAIWSAKVRALGIEVANHMSHLEAADVDASAAPSMRERQESLVEERLDRHGHPPPLEVGAAARRRPLPRRAAAPRSPPPRASAARRSRSRARARARAGARPPPVEQPVAAPRPLRASR